MNINKHVFYFLLAVVCIGCVNYLVIANNNGNDLVNMSTKGNTQYNKYIYSFIGLCGASVSGLFLYSAYSKTPLLPSTCSLE